jgi:hypothetical protein
MSDKKGITGKGSFQKRLEMLEQAINVRQPRVVVVLVDQHNREAPEHIAALRAIQDQLAVTPDDLVITLASNLAATDDDAFVPPDPSLPRLHSVVPQVR